jgi:nucleotide-binding universal stress UspA family protein
MSRIRRILHPSDFSRASGAAFTKAVDLAKTNKTELMVVHVLAPTLPMLGDGYVSPKVYEDLVASARGYGKKNFDALVAKAKKAGVRTGAPGSRRSFSVAWPDASLPSLRVR